MLDKENFSLAILSASQSAQVGDFSQFLIQCEQIAMLGIRDIKVQISVGNLLASFGFLSKARICYENALSIEPRDPRAILGLAHVARDAGDHAAAHYLFAELLEKQPSASVVRRSFLTSMEYNPNVTDQERLEAATTWGTWLQAQVGQREPHATPPLTNRPLRVGYVSPDFCQHTVGLFVKNVLRSHDHKRLLPYTYSAGQTNDWVTAEIKSNSIYRNALDLDDQALARQICSDQIDVLVDLSGHTAGSRLTAFALRPAPVMVSWLGYFATTGLSNMDAVILDSWHAPRGVESQFCEKIMRLAGGRLCYQPVPWAPSLSPPALKRNSVITFGCFNNTAKLNKAVLDLWATVMHLVPESRIILKWKTFNDKHFSEKTVHDFVSRGIDEKRVDLRGPSFHVDMLREYADIDIALDPFPFSGGMTSCEALWMGVPVITWPGSRVVSRQTHAILSQIGIPEYSAASAVDYVKIAVDLASDHEQLSKLRTTLRDRMKNSILMNITDFTKGFEDALISLYKQIENNRNSKIA